MKQPYRVIILAGGESSRFIPFTNRRKTGFTIMGKPLPWFTLENISASGVLSAMLVRSKENVELESAIGKKVGKTEVEFAVQDKPKGQANALLTAWNLTKRHEPVLVLNAYHFTAFSVISKMIEKYNKTGKSVIAVTKTETPWKYGIVNVEGDRITEVVEKPKRGRERSNLRVVGIYFLTPEAIIKIEKKPEAEYQLEDGLNDLAKNDGLTYLEIDWPIPSLKYAWDLFAIKDMLLGERQYVDKSAFVHKTAVIEGPCWVGPKAVVGAFCLLRKGVILEEGSQAERYLEIKNSIVGKNSHIHSGFIGDSVIGENCRIGAGFITANRRFDRRNILVNVKGETVDSGTTYLGAIVGDGSQIGINVGTMPGVVIGRKSTIWPGVTVKELVSPGSIVDSENRK